MVRVKENSTFTKEGYIDEEKWLTQLQQKGYQQNINLIKQACSLSQLTGSEQATGTGESCYQRGLMMAEVLSDLEADPETLAAALIYETYHYADLSLDVIEEQLGSSVSSLVKGVEKMSGLSSIHSPSKYSQSKHQIDNIRKMLLAMVDDVRVVLVKLAERLCVLRTSAPLPEALRAEVASETMDIYAPLANRLGIGAVKWEMEDLAFRYLEPDNYIQIAKGLKTKRIERDRFVNHIIDVLSDEIKKLGMSEFEVYGRSKHIHSIYKKMIRKDIPLSEIYDATAVRILVNTPDECYAVLGLVHSLWKQVVIEFDDYIVNPKPNGYQSLHTAVESEDGRVFEVQIRTFQMHELAEMGVAAHWKYKEGASSQIESHERKIEWLREVLAWHREMAENQGISEQIETEFLEDRVYVFTPENDVLDLPHGATPLDFAYHVHSQVGHRCRGSKVNGKIVPLTYILQTGDRVEILTSKEPRPSRDWINPHLNYLKSSRAKAKVQHWFKMQDFDKNKAEGQEILDKELKLLGLKHDDLKSILDGFNFKTIDDLYAALGRGDLKTGQILNKLTPDEPKVIEDQIVLKSNARPEASGSDLKIEGVGNLLTHMARCCQPVPGDDVIGYITLGKGVSIHRKDCSNIIHASDKGKKRLIEVSWGQQTEENYVVDVLVKAYDRRNLLKDITSLLSNEKAHVYGLQTKTDKEENLTYLSITIEIDGLSSLSKLLNKLGQIQNVIEVNRQS